MSKPTVTYASYCCPKDIERAESTYADHAESNKYPFDEYFFVYQRCKPAPGRSIRIPQTENFRILEITDEMYPGILRTFGIKYPDAVAEHITRGWEAPHFFAHHLVNLLKVLQHATSDYVVFADCDCYISKQQEGRSWVEEGIEILKSDPRAFVVCPSDGRPHGGPDKMMSQQIFLIDRNKFSEMEFLPWDGLFLDNGPFAPFYFLMEGFIYRHMVKNHLYRYVLPEEIARWDHLQWH